MGPENSDVETLDLNDATILPALVDSHVHLSMSGTMDQAERLRQLETTGFDRAEGVVQKHLDQHLAAGCHSIEHGFFMGYDNLSLMADKAVFWVRTAVTLQSYGRYLKQIGEKNDIALKNLDHQVEQLQTAGQLEVPIALGTDAGSPAVDHGIAVVDEMIILMEAGFPIEEIIRCATFNGAQLLGIKDPGLLVPGMPATFITVKGAPAGLPNSLRNIEGVYIKGKLVG